jgi:hypothetical protein
MVERWEPPTKPGEVETRKIYFGDRLASGETLSTATFTATGLTNVASSVTSDGFAVWKFQGATVNTDYEIACSVTTSLGNTLKETIVLRCRAG